MEITREIYWNVGRGVLIPMYAFVFMALVILIYGFVKRVKVYRLGKPLDRTDDLLARIAVCLKDVILQGKVRRVFWAGSAHGIFFWAFLLLLTGTTLVFIQTDFIEPLFEYRFLKGGFYKLFSFTLDIAGLLAILTMGGLFVRRYIVRPDGLETTKDDAIMHLLLFTILITGFIVEGLRMAVTELQSNMTLAYYSPIGLLFAKVFTGLEEASLRELHKSIWWVHFFLAIGFIVSIPFTKFRHIFTTSTNYIFSDRRPKGSIDTPDLEEEETESFGVTAVKDFTWKDILDADACTLCKRCQERCPAYFTEKPLSPMKVVIQIGEAAFNRPDTKLVETVTSDVLWSCTTCRACQEICPASIEHVNKILEMRRYLVLMEGEFPGEEVVTAVKNTEVNGNPMGMAFASRGDWAEGLSVRILEDGADVDILYFVGCYASFDKRNIKVARSFVKICETAGIKVGILGKGEKCCGEPMRKLGNEYLYQVLAKQNIERIKACGVKKAVTTCPHCFNTLDKDYRDFGFDIEVEHYTLFLNRLMKKDKLTMNPNRFNCTYHDSCFIGRYNDIFEEPRELVKAAGGTIREMSRKRLESFCCGGGGGLVLADEKLGSRINVARVKMAEVTKSDVLVSNCPFCLTMFEDGVKMADLDGRLVPKDIAEIIAERLKSDS